MESPLSLKKRGHERIEWVRQLSDTKRRKREERMCVGAEDEGSGTGITETLWDDD